jgi:branched-chain amino acid transport system substrate-binding protein
MRRTYLCYIALLVTLLLAACGGQQAAGPSEEPSGVATEAAEEPAEDPLGEVVVAPGQPVLIAAHQAISGDTASLGTDEVRGIEIAIADRGEELLGHPIELQVEDDECSAEGGTAGAQRIIADPQMIGSIGTSCSGAGVPASQILSEAGLVMISGSNTSPSLTSDFQGNPGTDWQEGYFRTAHNDLTQGAAAATFAYEELGARSAVTIHDGDPYTEGLATAFGDAFQELGGEIALATAVDKGEENMRPVLTEAAATSPDIVFFPIFQPEADFIVRQATEFDELSNTELLMGADGLLSDTFVEDIPETEGMYFSGPARPEGSAYEEFVGKYEEANGEGPIQAFHAHAYDAANMLFDAIEEVAVEGDDGSLTIGRQALRDALYATTDFEGLTGTLTCDEFGDCAEAKINIVQNTEEQETIADVAGNVQATYEFDETGTIVE